MKFDRWLQAKLAADSASNFKANRAVEKLRRKSLRNRTLVIAAVGLLSYFTMYDRSTDSFQEESYIASVFEEHEQLIADSKGELYIDILELEAQKAER